MKKSLGILSLVILGLMSSNAATVTWGGSSGDYATGANWVGGTVPDTNGGDTAVINSGSAIYTPGGDFPIHSGGTLQISGGSWTQVTGGAWIQMAGGTLLINGGTFNQGTAGNIIRDASSSIIVSSGIANFSGDIIYNPTASGALSITGGTVNIAGEFKPAQTFTLSGTTMNTTLISFSDGPGNLNITSGVLSVDGSGGYSGFYGGGAQGLNFTTGSSGTLIIRNYTIAELGTDGFMTNGTIQYNGAADAGSFTLSQVGSNVQIALTAVPEPSTYVLVGLGLAGLAVLRRRKILKA